MKDYWSKKFLIVKKNVFRTLLNQTCLKESKRGYKL